MMATPLNWHQAVALCEQRGEPYALVTVLGVTGSVPREPATKMVITGEHCYDTIGGGHREHRICLQARDYFFMEGDTLLESPDVSTTSFE